MAGNQSLGQLGLQYGSEKTQFKPEKVELICRRIGQRWHQPDVTSRRGEGGDRQ